MYSFKFDEKDIKTYNLNLNCKLDAARRNNAGHIIVCINPMEINDIP
jgi:hypothetical protein